MVFDLVCLFFFWLVCLFSLFGDIRLLICVSFKFWVLLCLVSNSLFKLSCWFDVWMGWICWFLFATVWFDSVVLWFWLDCVFGEMFLFGLVCLLLVGVVLIVWFWCLFAFNVYFLDVECVIVCHLIVTVVLLLFIVYFGFAFCLVLFCRLFCVFVDCFDLVDLFVLWSLWCFSMFWFYCLFDRLFFVVYWFSGFDCFSLDCFLVF